MKSELLIFPRVDSSLTDLLSPMHPAQTQCAHMNMSHTEDNHSHSLIPCQCFFHGFSYFFFFIFFFFLPKALTPRRDFFASVKGQAEHTHLSCVRNLPCTGPQGHIGILYNLWNQVGQKIKFIWGENEKMPWKRVSAVHLLAFVWRMFSLRHWRESMNNKWVLLQFRLFPPGVSCDDQELQNENHITRTMWFHSVLVLFWFRTWL